MTYVTMGLLVLGIAIATLCGVKYEPNKDGFMSIGDTAFLRGFWCIIVVLVHVPEAYQNRVQDMLGSFAYIGVTFFFMTSAYGLKYSIKKKPGYINHFWRRRLPRLLVPALIANAIEALISTINGNSISLLSFVNINNWVKVLLLYYVTFWLVYYIFPKFVRKSGYWQDVVMCLIVCGCSLIDRLTDFKITSIWTVEPLGFAYGIIAANHDGQINKWMKNKWAVKSICLMILSGILGIVYLKFKPVPIVGDYLLKATLGIAITVFIFTVLSKVKAGNRINGFLGGISYEVYLLHHAVFALIMALDTEVMNSGLFILTSVIITLVLAWLLKSVSEHVI